MAGAWVVLLCVCVAVRGAADFKRVPLTDLNPLAVCNDGSPATYFFRAGSGSGASIWTIYLEGGGFCADIASCTNRWHDTRHFMTSTELPPFLNDTTRSPDVNHLGINSGNATVNPHLYNANQVYLWYCSSDAYAGDVAASNETGGWHFRGKRIIETLIGHLLKVQIPSLTQAKLILFHGFSAGGMGIFNNADYVGQLLQKGAPYAEYRAYVDSGWLLDVPNFHPNNAPSRTSIQLLHKNYNATFDADCEAIYRARGEEWKCQFAGYVYPFITTPLFVAGYQFDAPFLNDVAPPFDAATGEYAELLRQTFLMQSEPLSGFFSANCYCHGTESYDGRWNFIKVNGTTASESVWDFLNGRPTRNVDTCAPLGCNPTCSCIYN